MSKNHKSHIHNWKDYNEALVDRGRITAVPEQHGNCNALPLPYDDIIRNIRQSGRKGWIYMLGV